MRFFIAITVLIFFMGCGGSSEPVEIDTFFKKFVYMGDNQEDRILKIDYTNMSVLSEYYTEGKVAYTAERAGFTDKVYAITRGSNSIEVLKADTLEYIKKVPFQHYPRSSAFNEILGLQLISGKNKPMITVMDIQKDEIIAVVGENNESNVINNFGGSNATGHPFWISDNKFALIDRENRFIDLYRIEKRATSWLTKDTSWQASKLSRLHTPTSVHHFIGKDLDGMNGGITIVDTPKTIFHAVAEGSREEFIPPKLLEIKLEGDLLIIKRETPLNYHPQMGGHHATYHPNGKHIYFPSAEGTLYIIEKETMSIIKTLKSGIGSAHVTFVPKKNLAMVINHNDTFVTIVNSNSHEKIKDVNVSGPQIGTAVLQSHTSFIDNSQNYFYAFATDNGYLYELDLRSLEINRKLYTGGNPIQGEVFGMKY